MYASNSNGSSWTNDFVNRLYKIKEQTERNQKPNEERKKSARKQQQQQKLYILWRGQ